MNLLTDMRSLAVFFDLDGTLTDPAEGIVNAVLYALRRYGIEETDREKLLRFIGPPLTESFSRYYGFSEEEAPKVVECYREYFAPTGIYENRVYDGIPELLSALKAEGKRLYIATSKPELFATKVLQHFGLDRYFDGVYGAMMDGRRTKKGEVIAYALHETGLKPSEVVMVGDRMHDIVGAKQNNMRSIGVLFGYGSQEELTDAVADAIAETVDDIRTILKGENDMNNVEVQIAKDLLKIKAVFFRPDEPFTWASGIKSPVYCDNRLTLTAPEVRNDVENGLAETIRAHYPEVEVLMGTSTAGIAHAAITAHLMDLPMGYVRSGAKDHGRQNQIEGKLEKGQKVVVVEDLISTGGSVIEVVNVLREAGAEVLGIVSIFTYGMKKGLERLEAADVKNVSLTNFDVIAQTAADEGYIKPEDVERLINFRNNPSDESWIGK